MQDFKLTKKYSFWFSPAMESNTANFENQIQKIGTFSTGKEFWSYYSYMIKPDKMPEGSQFFIFQEDIKPIWEDPSNSNGGRFILRIRHGWENRVWEELLMEYILDESPALNNVCGMIAHSKKNFILFSIWIKDPTNESKNFDEIQKWIISTIGVKSKIDLEYIPHPDIKK